MNVSYEYDPTCYKIINIYLGPDWTRGNKRLHYVTLSLSLSAINLKA